MVEKILYLSDTHGNFQALKNLESHLADPPDYLICMGDHFVTPSFRKIQDLFYNRIKNPLLNLLKINPKALDSEILDYTNPQKTTLRHSFRELKLFEKQLATDSTPFRLTDAEMAFEIRKFLTFEHYGHYTSNTAPDCKKQLGMELEGNALQFCNTIDKFIEAGTMVHIIEGNQDARTPIDFMPGIPEVKPLPINERVFYAGNFLRKRKYNFYDSLGLLCTKKTIHVLVGFDETISAAAADYSMDEIFQKTIIAEMRNRDLGEINLALHGLITADIFGRIHPTLNKENQLCLTGSRKIYDNFIPCHAIHGHLHHEAIDYKIFVEISAQRHGIESNLASITYLPENTFWLLTIL